KGTSNRMKDMLPPMAECVGKSVDTRLRLPFIVVSRTISMWNLKRSGAAPGAGVPKPENYAKKEFIYKIQIASVFLVSVRVLPWALRKAGVMEPLGIPATRR
ncbi:hypothetical protein FOZ63_010362, partial [Perkinsus olseni]